jgi:hypothetical protein
MQGFVDFGFGLLDRSDVEPNAQPTARIHFGVRSDLLPDDYRTWGKDVARVNVQPRYKRSAKKIDAAKKLITKKPAAPKAANANASATVVPQ